MLLQEIIRGYCCTYVQTNFMSQQAYSFSGEAAANYDQYLGPFLFEPSALLLASLVPSGFKGRVLELAAGSGRLTAHLVHRMADPALLTVTDLSADMLAIAQKKLQEGSIRFQREDMQALSFPDKAFDLVICQYGVMFPSDKALVFREMYRVLKPGGRLIFSTWEETARMPFFNLLYNQTLLPFFKGADKTKYLVPFHMHDPGLLTALMDGAGFSQSVVNKKILQARSPSPAELVNGFIHKHQLGREILEQDPGALEQIASRLEKEIGQQFGHGPVNCALTCLIGSAVR